MLERQQVTDLVISSLEDVPRRSDAHPFLDQDTRLIGSAAVVDSMGLVTAIVEIEQRLQEELGVTVMLADEQAWSQRNSPFRTVGSLADHILQLAAGKPA